jgi:hypothetical protein
VTLTNLNQDVYYNAIAVLNRHDVIIQTETGWQIIVKLFRRWLLNLASSNK